MTLRTGHGMGKGSPRIEVLPPDELPPSQAAGADPIAEGRDDKGRLTSSEAARAMAKLPRRSRFVPRKLVCDPRFEPHNRRRLEWQRARLVELASAHGSVSRGVGAIISSAAWLFAAAEFSAELAAESGNPEYFRHASSLSSTARQHELAAWELAVREAKPVEVNPRAAQAAFLRALSPGQPEPAPTSQKPASEAPRPVVETPQEAKP